MNKEDAVEIKAGGKPCSNCGRVVPLTHTNKYGREISLCVNCLPREEEIVQLMSYHAFTGN